MHISVLTVSDSASKNAKLDKSGPLLIELLKNSTKLGNVPPVADYSIVPDERSKISEYLSEHCAKSDLILTCGGTGLSKRDVTPEATKDVIEKECPGIVTALLMKGIEATPFGALTRLTAGIAGECLIINLPGSPKAVKEGFEVLEPILCHALSIMGEDRGEIVKVHGERNENE